MENTIEYLVNAPWFTCVVFTAVRLKLFTVLSGDPKSIEKIAAECGAKPHGLKLLLDACVGMKLVESQSGLYENAHFSEVYLVEGKQQYMGDLIQLQYDEFDKWHHLYDVISRRQSNRMPSAKDQYQTFIRAMHNIGLSGEADALVDAVDLNGCRRMIDVGGGSGIYSVALCRKYPQLQSILLDCKETLTATKKLIAGGEEKDRITLKEVDITRDAFGKNIDAVLLSDVLYDEALAPRILKKVHDCLSSRGKLMIRGYYADPEHSRPLFGALFALNQLVHDPRRKLLTLASLKECVVAAGFVIIRVGPLSQRSIILLGHKRTHKRTL